ncbi:MAG: hypothetical protein ACRELG_20155 [Gemmataceae bacterium]
MTSPASEFREEMLTGQPPAPTPVRYPLSARLDLLAGLGARRPRPKDAAEPQAFGMARARRMKQSARALAWWIPFWYVFAQVVLLVWMDESWPLNRIRVERDKFKQLHERLAEAPDRPLVLTVGSSRMDWGFQATRLNGRPGPDGRPLLVYNFGVPTAGPIHEALYVNDLLAQGVRPRLLLVEFVSTHLNQSRRGITSEEHFTVPHWLNAHQLLFCSRYFSNPRHAMIEWLESRVAPWYGYRWTVHERLLGNDGQPNLFDQCQQPMDFCGCRLLAHDVGTPQYRAFRYDSNRRVYAESLQHFHLGAKPAQAMRDLLARCRREHIPVAIVNMPVSKEFNALYSPEGQAQLTNFLGELRRRYGVEIIDASDWLAKEDFDDGFHVLRVGAYKFTTRMIVEVQKLLERTNRGKDEG